MYSFCPTCGHPVRLAERQPSNPPQPPIHTAGPGKDTPDCNAA